MRPSLPILLAGALLSGAAAASAPVNLYQATVAVADGSDAARAQGLRDALAAVLIRVTGDRAAAGSAEAQPLLGRAATLAQGSGLTACTGAPLCLRAVFDPRATDAALRAAGLPVWGPLRPTHLLWIALRADDGGKILVDAGAAAQTAPLLLAAAEARGLPLLFPSPARDRSGLSGNDVWNEALEPISRASLSYGADRVLAVHVTRELGGGWLSRWTALTGPGARRWTAGGTTPDAALAEGLQQLADLEAGQYAARGASLVQDLILTVRGVNSLQGYAQVLNYLRGLSPVRFATVDQAQDDLLVLRVRVEGEAQALTRAIAAGGPLHEDPAHGGAPNYLIGR